MSLCIVAGAVTTKLLVTAFTLTWVHSVERTAWQEDWSVEADRLVLVESRVKGSGAGMEPGDDAVLRDGWWHAQPRREVPELLLADSGAAGAWTLCAPACAALGTGSGSPIRLRPCA